MKWTWPWYAAAETYSANRYAKARKDTERRMDEGGITGSGVFADLGGLWYNCTLWPSTIFSGMTGICWEKTDQQKAEIPTYLEGTELAEGYRKREEIDRQIADLGGDRVLSFCTLGFMRAGRDKEAIRHATDRIPITMPGEVAGDESSPLRTPALIAMGLGMAGIAGAGVYYNHKLGNPLGNLLPGSTPSSEEASAGAGEVRKSS